jgi:hypothetical protein
MAKLRTRVFAVLYLKADWLNLSIGLQTLKADWLKYAHVLL